MKRYTRDQVNSWYNDINDYPDVDPDKFAAIGDIDWDINMEDVECILYDNIPLSNVVAVRNVLESDVDAMNAIEDGGYEDGYIFTYDNGEEHAFAYKPYPHNLDPMDKLY